MIISWHGNCFLDEAISCQTTILYSIFHYVMSRKLDPFSSQYGKIIFITLLI